MTPKRFVGWIAALVFSFLLTFVVMPAVVLVVIATVPKMLEEPKAQGEKLVAVVEIDGMIVDSRDVLEELYRQAENESVKGIVLRVNSPGGAVGPSQEVYAAVKKLKAKKPIVVSMGALAASGGLYVALAGSKVYCQPGTLTGSIGVILQMPNVRKIADKFGFEMLTFTSGALKDVGNAFREMSETERQFLQSTVQTAYQDFVKAVVEGRALPEDKVRSFADGRVILGSQAVEWGLADGFGDVNDAARAVFEILGTPLEEKETPKIFYPLDNLKYVRQFLGSWQQLRGVLSTSPRLEYVMN